MSMEPKCTNCDVILNGGQAAVKDRTKAGSCDVVDGKAQGDSATQTNPYQESRQKSQRSEVRGQRSEVRRPILSTGRVCDIQPCLHSPTRAIISPDGAQSAFVPFWNFGRRIELISSLTSRFCPQVIVSHRLFQEIPANTMIRVDGRRRGGYPLQTILLFREF